ncbi:hypothetical protein PoB_002789200 [Plakobranchus ocellatus]|uniref:MD-2-related lipid-recognition domain-containing protein n=1 Tax=Plakobranchus ocellatus TaxID=259542 RepID=A0AAV4A248_9GAST|nr:hypothetical protein PoB_002789200 [Plakobranchus ocellatus]
MAFQRTATYVKALAFAVMFGAVCGEDALIFRSEGTDTGYATNCGSEPFNMSWTPKVLSAKRSVEIDLKYTIAHDLNGGDYNLTVTYYGDKTPFLVYANPFTCDDIKEILPCPMKKGGTIQRKLPIEKTKYLLSFPGHFIITAEVKNEKQEQMFCAKLDVVVNNN